VLSAVRFQTSRDAAPVRAGLAATYTHLHGLREQASRLRDDATERLGIARDKLETAGRILEPAIHKYANLSVGSFLVGTALLGAGWLFGLTPVAVLGAVAGIGGTCAAFAGLMLARNKYVAVRKDRDKTDSQKADAHQTWQRHTEDVGRFLAKDNSSHAMLEKARVGCDLVAAAPHAWQAAQIGKDFVGALSDAPGAVGPLSRSVLEASDKADDAVTAISCHAALAAIAGGAWVAPAGETMPSVPPLARLGQDVVASLATPADRRRLGAALLRNAVAAASNRKEAFAARTMASVSRVDMGDDSAVAFHSEALGLLARGVGIADRVDDLLLSMGRCATAEGIPASDGRRMADAVLQGFTASDSLEMERMESIRQQAASEPDAERALAMLRRAFEVGATTS
jgi:hypothetical protein